MRKVIIMFALAMGIITANAQENVTVETTNGRDYVKVHIGQQDGVWVAATTWMIGGSSRGCHPGRKWGEFASEQNALLWAFGELLAEEGVLPPAAIKTVKARIFEIRQYKLF